MEKKGNICIDMMHTLGKAQNGSMFSCFGGKGVVMRSLSDVKITRIVREYGRT